MTPQKETSTKRTRVIVYGLGHIGRMVFESLLNQRYFYNQTFELAGVVDIVPESRQWVESHKLTAGSAPIPACTSLKELIAKIGAPDVIVHTTASNLSVVVEQLREILEARIPVVSSTEELFYPWIQNPAIASELDRLAQEFGVAVLGTGVNPGFIMDVLPAAFLQTVQSVESIRILRTVNAATRRTPLLRKLGIGLSEENFHAQLTAGRISLVGAMESMDFLSAHLGWNTDHRGQSIEPILALKEIPAASTILGSPVRAGNVCGIRQFTWAEVQGKKVLELDLRISLDVERPGDRITIAGFPPLTVWIEGGVQGDQAAVASLVRGIPIVLRARPGLVRRLERDHFS